VQCVSPVQWALALGPSPIAVPRTYNNWAPHLGMRGKASRKGSRDRHPMPWRAGLGMLYVGYYLNTIASEDAKPPPFAVANKQVFFFRAGGPQHATHMAMGLSGAAPGRCTNTAGRESNYQFPTR